MERHVAIDNVCAWPNLTLTPSGEIIATIFNQPCHGLWEGDVEAWTSEDGRFWRLCGVPAPHGPGTNHMNVAAGLANDGDLVVLAAGWNKRPPVPSPLPVSPHDPLPKSCGGGFADAQSLPVLVCRSNDGGQTWERTENLTPPDGETHCVPYGDCVAAADKSLRATVYGKGGCWFAHSVDDGHSWNDYSLIAEDICETDILSLGDGVWLAVGRSNGNHGLRLYRSNDDGRSWDFELALTTTQQHPGHLLRLRDGRILLCHSVRNIGVRGVGARVSADDGRSWSNPKLLVQYDSEADGGYPSSVQRADGAIVTAYYCQKTDVHQRYHMGVLIYGEDVIDEMAATIKSHRTFRFGPE